MVMNTSREPPAQATAGCKVAAIAMRLKRASLLFAGHCCRASLGGEACLDQHPMAVISLTATALAAATADQDFLLAEEAYLPDRQLHTLTGLRVPETPLQGWAAGRHRSCTLPTVILARLCKR